LSNLPSMPRMNRLPELLEADGLTLRRWTIDDASALQRAVAASEEHLRPWMPWMAVEPIELEARRALIDRWQHEWEADGDSVLGIYVDGEVVGSSGLHRRRSPHALEIGYWIHVDFLRRGLATKVAATLTEAALTVPGIDAVEIHHDKANHVSARIPRALGYRFIGEAPDTPEAPAEIGVDWAWRFEVHTRVRQGL
jgi:ribosomal-protein-serine acetyltransferase